MSSLHDHARTHAHAHTHATRRIYLRDLADVGATVPDLAICGTLHSVDQYLNIKLLSASVEDVASFPHLQSVKNCFIRGTTGIGHTPRVVSTRMLLAIHRFGNQVRAVTRIGG